MLSPDVLQVLELKVPALVLGQAAYSIRYTTADALLSQAAVNAETVKVPA